MTDSLRTRIAAVLAQHYPQTTGYQDELTDWCQCGMPRDHVADLLIRELDIFKEDGECSYCHAQLPGCRYICDWKTDE